MCYAHALGPWSDGCSQFIVIDFPFSARYHRMRGIVGRAQRNIDRDTPIESGVCNVLIKKGLKHDHLVARLQEGSFKRINTLVCAGRDHDLRVGIDLTLEQRR